MLRGLFPLLLGAVFCAPAFVQRGSLDPAFESIPFDQWLGERDSGRFRWTVSVPRAGLSFHQRLVARIEIKVDGRDLAARRGNGKLMFYVQITRPEGQRYQTHESVELAKLDENIRSANLEYSQRAFVLPGDFRVAAAILDTATGEHSARQSLFRVPPHSGLLADAWLGLPPVEFIAGEDPPDAWYLPEIRGRLQWAAAVHSPARLNLVLNVVPPAPSGSRRTHSGDLAVLIPTLKAISQTGSSSISAHVEVLDLARRRSAFQQNVVRDLDWPRMKSALGDANTASIDIHSLSERHHDAQFFVSQVRRILRASETSCVLVVLTPPVVFESGEDLEPISLEALPPCRVFYIRCQGSAQLAFHPVYGPMGGRRLGPRGPGPVTRQMPGTLEADELEPTLKPLKPKVFDVQTPQQATRALDEIRKALLTSE